MSTPAALGSRNSASAPAIPVWDRFVRVGHWVLAAAFLVAYLTEDDLLTIHVWAGYLALALVVLRIVWGFVGSTHARFSDFLYSPLDAWRYLIALPLGRSKRYLGHSPAGAAMVYALLLGIAATTVSGIVLYAYEENAGPLAGIVAQPSEVVGRNDGEDEDESGNESAGEGFWEEAHEVLANLTLALVFLHVGGVLLASVAHRENLVRAMITGNKRPLDETRR